MSEPITRVKPPPLWKIWANPIFRRYARSRLRPVDFGIRALIALLLAGFIFFAIQGGAHRVGGTDPIDLARIPLIPLLFLQGFILFVLATGQVAGGMTAEADEGVLDYQRLAPMTPMAKVVGYLFGLPIREWALFALTMPFSLWCLWRGDVPLTVALQLYGVFMGAGILHHLTGLVAGTVIKNRRFAFLGSIALVLMLYTIVPQAAKFGLVYFKYLTIMPVVEECYPHLIPREAGTMVEAVQTMLPSARFFGLNFPQAVFTFLSQGGLILVMMTMLWRRWRRTESHLLGKFGAIGFFAWIQLVLLGNALPLMDTGELFPSQEFGRKFGRMFKLDGEWVPEPSEALAMVGLYGVATLLMIWWMTLIITPSRDGQIRGWRRARKVGQTRLSLTSDAATSMPWVVVMIAMGLIGWSVFAHALIGSRWFPGYELASWTTLVFALILGTAGLSFSAILETSGKQKTTLVVIIAGVVPMMLGTVLGITSDSLAAAATWFIGICPIAWPVYVSIILIPVNNMPIHWGRAIPYAFGFWQFIGVIVTVRLLYNLRQSRKTIAAFVADGEK